MQTFDWETSREQTLGDLGIDGKNFLMDLWELECEDMKWIQLTYSFCEHDDEPWQQGIYWTA
jgi:hypothetical protein